MILDKLASAIRNDVVGGLRGYHTNMSMSLDQIKDDIIDMRLQVIKEYSLKGILPYKDLLTEINCIPVDCKNIDVKVSKHCLATIKHKNIYQYTLDKHLVNTYHSYKEAAESVNAHSSGISLCCRGLQKTCKGYLWEEDYDIG